jgi:hypothetical protein
MSLWRQVTRGLRVLTNGGRADRELDDEIRVYFEHVEKRSLEQGLSLQYTPSSRHRAASGGITFV